MVGADGLAMVTRRSPSRSTWLQNHKLVAKRTYGGKIRARFRVDGRRVEAVADSLSVSPHDESLTLAGFRVTTDATR
jgi:hypothetical protein